MSLDLTITLSRFDIWWHACRFSGTTSWPVNDKALHIVSFRTLSWISWAAGFNSRSFLVRTKSNLCYSYFFEKVSNLSLSSLSQSVISENLTSSSMSSSLLRFSIWRLVKNQFSQDIKTFKKIIKELRVKNNFKDDDDSIYTPQQHVLIVLFSFF